MVIPCLLIEDDRDTRDALEMILADFGYRPQCAASRDNVLRMLKFGSAEFVIMDIHMPGCPVIPFLDALAAHQPRPKVIAMSCDYEVLGQLEPFVDGCLKKPVNPDALAELLRVLGARPQAAHGTTAGS